MSSSFESLFQQVALQKQIQQQKKSKRQWALFLILVGAGIILQVLNIRLLDKKIFDFFKGDIPTFCHREGVSAFAISMITNYSWSHIFFRGAQPNISPYNFIKSVIIDNIVPNPQYICGNLFEGQEDLLKKIISNPGDKNIWNNEKNPWKDIIPAEADVLQDQEGLIRIVKGGLWNYAKNADKNWGSSTMYDKVFKKDPKNICSGGKDVVSSISKIAGSGATFSGLGMAGGPFGMGIGAALGIGMGLLSEFGSKKDKCG